METTHRQASVGLEYGVRVIRRRAWVIGICLALTALAAFGFSKIQTKQYTATAALLFTNSSVAQQASGLPVASQTDPQGQRATNLILVQLADVISKRTAAVVGSGLSGTQIRQAVSAASDGQSDVVTVSATWTSRVLAARIANVFANEFVRQQQQNNALGIQAAINLVEQQYQSLAGDQRAGAQGQALIDHLESLKILEAMQTNTQLVQAATVPSSPSSPRVLRNTLLGAVVGLLLGLGLAFLLERLDRRMRDPADVEQSWRLPLLGYVPHLSGDMASETATFALEPFQMLRAHLRYFNVDRELRTLLVVSAQPAEGKTTISRGLAAAAASMGTRTLLIEADLRKPNLTRALGLRPGVGLAGALVSDTAVEHAIQHVDLGGRPGGNGAGRLLDVLPAGAVPPNPTELLESHAMEDLLAWAREEYELVILDTPPLSVVADAIPLVRRVDGVIVVSRLGISTRDGAHRLRERLDHLGAPVLGVVVDDARRSISGDYGYGYRYGDKDAEAKPGVASTANSDPDSEERVPVASPTSEA
jgi:capsular exopolysaccharide synthesis family protein